MRAQTLGRHHLFEGASRVNTSQPPRLQLDDGRRVTVEDNSKSCTESLDWQIFAEMVIRHPFLGTFLAATISCLLLRRITGGDRFFCIVCLGAKVHGDAGFELKEKDSEGNSARR